MKWEIQKSDHNLIFFLVFFLAEFLSQKRNHFPL